VKREKGRKLSQNCKKQGCIRTPFFYGHGGLSRELSGDRCVEAAQTRFPIAGNFFTI